MYTGSLESTKVLRLRVVTSTSMREGREQARLFECSTNFPSAAYSSMMHN